jgi:hypothetical protein
MKEKKNTERIINHLPEWWYTAAMEYNRFELRPYRPPKFVDQSIVQPVIKKLQAKNNIHISLMCKNPVPGKDWEVIVDNELCCNIGRHRDPSGYTIYELTEEEFIKRVEACVNN